MEINANREFGQLMYDLIRGRLVGAGLEITPLVVTNLSNFLQTAARELYLHNGELWRMSMQKKGLSTLSDDLPWLDALVNWNPHTQLIVRTFMPMVWLSLVEPGNDRLAVQVVPHTNKFFADRGYRELTEEEMSQLTERVIALHQRPYSDRTLGAAGYALYYATRRSLSGTSLGRNRNAKTRRSKFVQEAWRLCKAVEATRELAERKGHASLLGEKLEAELRASRAANTTALMARFWEEFNLFFSGSQLAK